MWRRLVERGDTLHSEPQRRERRRRRHLQRHGDRDIHGDREPRLSNGTIVNYTISFSGLTAAATAGDIHIGAPGVAGAVAVPFKNVPASTSDTFSGSFTATDVQAATGGGVSVAAGSLDGLLAAMRAGNTYTNIHTGTYSDGEIRGQNQPGQ